jgi:hypothetical protein
MVWLSRAAFDIPIVERWTSFRHMPMSCDDVRSFLVQIVVNPNTAAKRSPKDLAVGPVKFHDGKAGAHTVGPEQDDA